jgi:hypothetical protein
MSNTPKDDGRLKTGLVMDDAEQSRRFIEGARDLGCEENLPSLADALRRVAKARPQHRPDPRSAKDEKPLPD